MHGSGDGDRRARGGEPERARPCLVRRGGAARFVGAPGVALGAISGSAGAIRWRTFDLRRDVDRPGLTELADQARDRVHVGRDRPGTQRVERGRIGRRDCRRGVRRPNLPGEGRRAGRDHEQRRRCDDCSGVNDGSRRRIGAHLRRRTDCDLRKEVGLHEPDFRPASECARRVANHDKQVAPFDGNPAELLCSSKRCSAVRVIGELAWIDEL